MAEGKHVATNTNTNTATVASTGGVPKSTKKASVQELVTLRNRFFYVYYRKLSLIFVAALILCGLSLVSAFYFAGRKTPPVYIPIAPNGQIVQTYPLNQPSNADPEVMTAWVTQWAMDGARKAFTYDYINFGEQVNSAQSFFTYRGWESFVKELGKSQNFNTVQEQKMIVKFTPMSVPVIKGQQVIDGRLAWSLTFDAAVTYIAHDGLHQGFRQNVVVRVVVFRMSTVDSPKGIGIDQIVLEEVPTK